MKSPVNHLLPLAALLLLSACASGGGKAGPLPAPGVNGPAADYPMVIGEPFTIGNKTYTPADTLNYDAVGFAAVSGGTDAKIAGGHKTLPLPSYVEVTNLDTGTTVLVRLESRGPMVNDRLIELTPGAAAQLGIAPGATAPVRVRRVNPPEAERAMLRSGDHAPMRMETPAPLLKVLKRKLADQEPLAPPARPTPIEPDAGAWQAPPPPQPPIAPPPPELVPPRAPERAPYASGDLVVQIAAFSTSERAQRAATPLGATVSKPGQYWYVRLGPFATMQEAEAALEKARAAGYSDARIQHAE